VGISTLFRCGPCRRTGGTNPSWVFWTSQAILRYAEMPVQAMWVVQMPAVGPTFAQKVGRSSLLLLPTKEQDRVHGLAGEAGEWELRSEALFNASPLPALQREMKSAGRGPSRSLSNEHLLAAVSNSSERQQGIGLSIGDGRVLERARALRRDLRAYIAQTTARDGVGNGSSAYDAAEPDILPNENDNRRRRRSLLGLMEDDLLEDEGSSSAREARSDEREFRRRRTAEILESGRERAPPSLPNRASGRVFDGLVGR